MAPAVFVKKKTGEIRLSVDYRELNKKTTRDAYPLPLPDKVQDCLAGSSIFSTLDLQSGYWQIPAHPNDREKIAFSPGPGMGTVSILSNVFWFIRGARHLSAFHGQDPPRFVICYNIS